MNSPESIGEIAFDFADFESEAEPTAIVQDSAIRQSCIQDHAVLQASASARSGIDFELVVHTRSPESAVSAPSRKPPLSRAASGTGTRKKKFAKRSGRRPGVKSDVLKGAARTAHSKKITQAERLPADHETVITAPADVVARTDAQPASLIGRFLGALLGVKSRSRS